VKQGVALTGRKSRRNTTGPPSRAALDDLRYICECYRRRQTTTDGDRRLQTPATVSSLARHIMSRRASKK